MRVGIASDHGGFELKQQVVSRLHAMGHEVADFGPDRLDPQDDYPDYVIPLATAVMRGAVQRGIAICGSGVGACIVANKLPGVRSALIHDTYSARQGVEDDDMNVLCLGGRVVDVDRAWELIRLFLEARFSGAERHRRRLAKIAALESHDPTKQPQP